MHNDTIDAVTRTPVLGRPATLAGFALFILIGGTAALFGPTIPAIRSTFHISAATAGFVLSGHFTGALAGILLPGFLPARLRAPRLVVAAAVVCLGVGCLGIATAPNWQPAVGGAFVEGAGWGGLVIAFNSLFATGFGARSPAMLILLNALYGVGAIIAPAGVGLLTAGRFREPFLAAALCAALLLPLSLTLPNREVSGAAPADAANLSAPPRILWPLIAFVAAFFLYGGLEGGIGAWETTHLVATGLSVATAATVTSLFWLAYTAGRLVMAPVSLLLKPERLVLGSLACLVVLLLLARVESVTAAAYTACGLALAPIFPLSLVWSSRLIRASQRITSVIISGDLFGAIILSTLLGRLITATSAESIPFAFAAMAAGALCILLGVEITLGTGPVQDS